MRGSKNRRRGDDAELSSGLGPSYVLAVVNAERRVACDSRTTGTGTGTGRTVDGGRTAGRAFRWRLRFPTAPEAQSELTFAGLRE